VFVCGFGFVSLQWWRFGVMFCVVVWVWFVAFVVWLCGFGLLACGCAGLVGCYGTGVSFGLMFLGLNRRPQVDSAPSDR